MKVKSMINLNDNPLSRPKDNPVPTDEALFVQLSHVDSQFSRKMKVFLSFLLLGLVIVALATSPSSAEEDDSTEEEIVNEDDSEEDEKEEESGTPEFIPFEAYLADAIKHINSLNVLPPGEDVPMELMISFRTTYLKAKEGYPNVDFEKAAERDLSTQVDFFLSNPDFYKTFLEALVKVDRDSHVEEEVKLLHGLSFEEVEEVINSIIDPIPVKERPRFTLNTLENTFFTVFIAIKYPYLTPILLQGNVIRKVVEWMEGMEGKRVEWEPIRMQRERDEALQYMDQLTQNDTEEDEEGVLDEERVAPSFQRFVDALGWKVEEEAMAPAMFSVFHDMYRHSFSYVTLPLDKLTKVAQKQSAIRDSFILHNQAYFKRFIEDLGKSLPDVDIVEANNLLESVKVDMRKDKGITEDEARNSGKYGMTSEFFSLENTFRLVYFCLKDGTGLECNNVFSKEVTSSLFISNENAREEL